MSFCPRCGAATQPSMSFCTACGENLPAVPATPSAGLAGTATADPLAAWRGRPVGKRVKPIVVVILALLTLTIYTFFFWWRTTREVDAYAGSRAHGPARVGVLVLTAGLLLAAGIFFAVAGSYDWAAIAEERIPAPTGAQLQADYEAHPAYPFTTVLQVVGTSILLVGLWRMWSAMREDELRRGRRDALDPRLPFAVLVAGVVVTVVTTWLPLPTAAAAALGLVALVVLVLTFVVYHQTQARLNEMWDATAP